MRALVSFPGSLGSLALGASLSLVGCGPGANGTDGGAIDAAVAPGTDAGTVLPRNERYIRSETDTRMVIELDAVDGAGPRSAVEGQITARLTSLLDKPAGVAIVHGAAIASRGADHAWTDEELMALANESFADDEPAGTVVLHVMWLDGHHARDTASGRILGSQWSHTHIALFHDSIETTCQGQPLLGERLCEAAQYGVWLHEIGHALGLVDNGLAMVSPHEDAAHPGHDQDEGCLMYYAYEGSEGLSALTDSLLGGGSVADFDAQCLADIAAVRDR